MSRDVPDRIARYFYQLAFSAEGKTVSLHGTNDILTLRNRRYNPYIVFKELKRNFWLISRASITSSWTVMKTIKRRTNEIRIQTVTILVSVTHTRHILFLPPFLVVSGDVESRRINLPTYHCRRAYGNLRRRGELRFAEMPRDGRTTWSYAGYMRFSALAEKRGS